MTRVGIAGVGLIGGSIGLRARAAGRTAIGYDIDSGAALRARERGAIDTIATGMRDLVARCDTLVVALPVDETMKCLRELSGLAADELPDLILDVASVKTAILAGPRPAHFVATHPMAGRERGGIDAADAGLFAGAVWAYVPPDETLPEEAIRAFIVAMGAAPLAIGAAEHDTIVALTSHLPQALSVVLGAQLAEAAGRLREVTELSGPGMMSMLRLARSPESVWAPIVAANAQPLAAQLRACGQTLASLAQDLEQGDISVLMSYFGDARAIAEQLEERFSSRARSSPYQ